MANEVNTTTEAKVAEQALLGLAAGIRAAVEDPKGIPIRAALGDSRAYFPGMGCQCAARSESECGCPGVDWTPRELRELRSKYAMHHAEAERLTALVHAARAVVNRWDTPLWKDVPATAGFINRLRKLLPANVQGHAAAGGTPESKK